MCQVIAEYNSGRMKLATAAKEFGVPRNTLRRKAAEHNDNDCRGSVAYNRERDLGFENEKKFMEHILKLQKTGQGLTMIELTITAFKFVHRNGIRTTFNTEKGMTGYD